MCRAGLAAVALVACGGSGEDEPAPETFLAFSSSFAPFRDWPSYFSEGPPNDGTFTPDVLGTRMQYINKKPASGQTGFAVGTIIVEARDNPEKTIFAAVKRGGGFNAGGATDWEWFEIRENPVAIVWRGFGPPAGEMYGGDPDGGCNSCHITCGSNNDFVCSPNLQLATF